MSEQLEQRYQLTLLIDADDTLWHSNIYYIRCSDNYVKMFAELGIPQETVGARVDQEEHGNIPTLGYGPHSYAQALKATCHALLADRGEDVLADALARTEQFTQQVRHQPMELLPQVAETLERLGNGAHLILVTKGHNQFQRDKLALSGLEPFFERVYVLAEKHPQAYRDIIDRLGLSIADTWMIGNSPKSDINPATEIGVRAVFIPYEHTWHMEHARIEREDMVVTVEHFADLPEVFGL